MYTRHEVYIGSKNTKECDVRREIQVHPGFCKDTVMRFPHQGNMHFGEDTSALVVKFEEKPEGNIRREGNDLIQIYSLSLQEALQANSISLVTLNGERIEQSIGKLLFYNQFRRSYNPSNKN
jgi:DnaJ-class molecular chaperone